MSAVTVHLIEKRFISAGLWCLAAAALSAVGLMHSYAFTATDAIGNFGVPAWPYVAGYTAMAAVFLAARWLVVEPLKQSSRP